MKTYRKEIDNISQQIQKKYKPEKIILFGSFAYGKPRAASDIDLTVIKKTKDRFLDRLKKISYLIKTPLGTDILVYTPKEWQELLQQNDYFAKEIDQKGLILYEKQ